MNRTVCFGILVLIMALPSKREPAQAGVATETAEAVPSAAAAAAGVVSQGSLAASSAPPELYFSRLWLLEAHSTPPLMALWLIVTDVIHIRSNGADLKYKAGGFSHISAAMRLSSAARIRSNEVLIKKSGNGSTSRVEMNSSPSFLALNW